MKMAVPFGSRAASTALALLACAASAAQEPAPSPSPPLPEMQFVLPPPRPADSSPRVVVVPGRPGTGRGSAGAVALKAWRSLGLAEGEGRLLIDGAPRRVKAGQTVEGYVVRAVGPGRLVLERAAELAIVTFDATGAARVRVVFEADPTPQKMVQPKH
jgi:hypothetical protein